VDVGLYGHHHSYQRTCQVLNETCLAPSSDPEYHAPMHAVVRQRANRLPTPPVQAPGWRQWSGGDAWLLKCGVFVRSLGGHGRPRIEHQCLG
jgi:hypothetical protein